MQTESYADTVYEAELSVPMATARIMRLHLDKPTNRIFRRDSHYWLDLCLTPRPEKVRGCYGDRWGPHRYERLGEIFLVPPGEALHLRSDGGGDQASIVCEIEATAVDCWLDGGIEWTDQRLAAGLDIAHPHIRSCLMRLAQEVARPERGGVVLVEMIAMQLAIEVARYCQAIAEGPISGGLASWRLRLIDERLQQSGPVPSLEELAALCNVSTRHLTRGFRSSRGCSIGNFIAQTQIDRAKRLLGSSESIKAIAFLLGFTSPSSFAFAFRRATGSTPSQFRQRQLRPPS